jgi:outer membrane lipoprotein carrier protein
VLFLGLVGSTLLATPLAAADAEKPDTVAVATGAADSSAPADPELAAVLGHFDAAIADIQDVRATFTQRNWSPVFEDWEYSAGRLWYRVPGELVMRYEEPLHQEVFIDTSGVWVYLVDQRQAQRYPFTTPAERDGSLAILWRPSHELAERYTITLAAAPPRGEAGGSWLALVPRDAEVAQVVSGLFLRLDPARGLSDCILLERANGERVRLEIDTFEANPGLDDDVFRFVPPEGVDVVRF